MESQPAARRKRSKAEQQKGVERYWAENAARLLGEAWTLGPNREQPDFVVETGAGAFGLEVTECHIGPISEKSGSGLREGEMFRQKWLNNLRKLYEGEGGAKLHLRYYRGRTDKRRAAEFIDVLLSAKLEEKGEFADFYHDFDDGRVFAFKTPHPFWQMSDDRSGRPSADGHHLQASIDAKQPKLAKYREACPDVRLLVVAQQMYNSGKVELPAGFLPDLKGFGTVYFYSYPREVLIFDHRRCSEGNPRSTQIQDLTNVPSPRTI